MDDPKYFFFEWKHLQLNTNLVTYIFFMYCQMTFSDNILNISILFKNPLHATANNHIQRNLTPLRSIYIWGGSRPRFEPERGDLRYRDDSHDHLPNCHHTKFMVEHYLF